MFVGELAEGCIAHLNNRNGYDVTNKGKILLEELHKLWKHHAAHIKELLQRKNTLMNKLIKIIQNFKLAIHSW